MPSYPCLVHSHATTWHDAGVAMLLPAGTIVALASERVDRIKHSLSSRAAYDHLRERYAGCCDFGGAADRFVDTEAEGLEGDRHHRYHAASAYFGSGFPEAAVLVIDGQGPEARPGAGPERRVLATTSIWRGCGSSLEPVELLNPGTPPFAAESLGHFYTAVGAMAGMTALHEEGKTMGLAAYGGPSCFLDFLRKFACSHADGTYRIDGRLTRAALGSLLGPRYYGWGPQPREVQAVWKQFVLLRGDRTDADSLLGGRSAGESLPGEPAGDVTQQDMDIAYAGQTILEEIVLGLAARAKRLTGSRRLCLAGGVALNCAANGRIARAGLFDELFVVPAPGDDGQAIGKLFHDIHGRSLGVDTTLRSAFLGPPYTPSDLECALQAEAARIRAVRMEPEDLQWEVVRRLSDGEVVAWFHGRSELGPRALGHRSILADPRDPGMRDRINATIKHREWYRPLAPVVPERHVSAYFELDAPSPFMSFAASVRSEVRDLLPAVTHVDGSARVQTVPDGTDDPVSGLLDKFGQATGIPVLLNTSFNRRDEPIVETPRHAIASFLAMNLDALALGDHLVTKV